MLLPQDAPRVGRLGKQESPGDSTVSRSVVFESGGQLLARFDVELAVAVGQVHLDGPQGDEEGLRDLLVGLALGGELADAQFGGGGGGGAGLCDAAPAGARK